jgi:hypothetical protein
MFILAVHIPSRTRAETDMIRVQNNNTMNTKFNTQNDNTDTMSDDFDSDSKENENVKKDRFKENLFI